LVRHVTGFSGNPGSGATLPCSFFQAYTGLNCELDWRRRKPDEHLQVVKEKSRFVWS
jgi:hypothetical protein